MEIYTLDGGFKRAELVEGFTSAIWTERYSLAGDVSISLKDSPGARELLAEGTLLSEADSNEVMLIDTLTPEENTLRVTGLSVTGFLDERNVIVARSYAGLQVQNLTLTKSPGDAMGYLAQVYAAPGVFLSANYPYDAIPNLSLGAVDTSGTVVALAIPYGSLYAALTQLASTYSLGFKIYLDHADASGYALKFTVYRGRDLTSDQSTYPLVRFSELLQTLSNVKELRSIKGYKTYARAWATGLSDDYRSSYYVAPGEAYVPGTETATGFDRRSLAIFASDIREGDFGSDTDPAGAATRMHDALVQRARDGLANNNYTKVVDGEVVPQSYTYGVNFTLGDIIELEAASGTRNPARVTEYIRSQDAIGRETAYPTISVI